MPRSLDGHTRTPSVKRTRFATNSGSSSDFNSSQDQERSTPSFNHASSRYPDPLKEELQPQAPELDVRALWLDAGKAGRFLLLEDTDTGDILMPLSRLKELLGDNYSRCLNIPDNRAVTKDKQADFGIYDTANQLYWLWPFESPPHIKAIIRQQLRDYSTGHIRLVLLPVVFNAMSKILHDSRNARKRDDTRITPKFTALQAALKRVLHASRYAPLLTPPGGRSVFSTSESRSAPSVLKCDDLLFEGPDSVALTASKYMTVHREISKKKAYQETKGKGSVKRKSEATDLTELREEMSSVQDHMSDQAKKMELLESSLRETKIMISRFFELFTNNPHPEALYSQVRECLSGECFGGDQDWDAACLQARHSGEGTPSSQVSTQVCAPYSSETTVTPTQSNYPLKYSTMRRQQSMVCLPMTIPVQDTQYPQVACKAHHPAFPSPFNSARRSQADGYLGHEGKMVYNATTSMLHGRNSAYDCMPRSRSYIDLHSGANEELQPSFLSNGL